MNKVKYGQFYTKNSHYIVGDLINIIPNDKIVVDPFVGYGDLIKLLQNEKEIYDIDPKIDNTIKQDTLLNPLNYINKWIITNPPYLARNKNKDKTLYDKYDLNDLYKIALKTIMGCEGGVIIIPLNFFSGQDDKIRKEFLSQYKITKLKIFEEQVFDDTSYTVCAFSFIKENNDRQIINTIFLPSEEIKNIELTLSNNYMFGENFFKIINHENPLKITRLVNYNVIKPNTYLYLRATDTGTDDGRISLTINKNHFYGKNTDRTFATIILSDDFSNIDINQQQNICNIFNFLLEKYRLEYNSLFLNNYRNSTKSYSRKRISFNMAYKLISYIIKNEKWDV